MQDTPSKEPELHRLKSRFQSELTESHDALTAIENTLQRIYQWRPVEKASPPPIIDKEPADMVDEYNRAVNSIQQANNRLRTINQHLNQII